MHIGPKAVRKVLLGIAVTVGLGFSATGCSPTNDETRVRTQLSHQMTIAAMAMVAMKVLMLRS